MSKEGVKSMKSFKGIIWVMIIICFASFAYGFFFAPAFEAIHVLNFMFILSLILIVVGAGTIFLYSPPFQRTAYNFSYFFSKLKRENKVADDVERKDVTYKGDDLKEKKRPKWVTSIFISGILFAVISTVLSIMIHS